MIARVFPHKTKASPVDKLAFFGPPPMFLPEISEVHVSVTFTWDIKYAEWLAGQWEPVAPVKMGGPAFNEAGADFVPGKYLKSGYVITSRGCPNKCWFCSVWKREPSLRELPIRNGWNVLDDNLLACSDQHIESVFTMLKSQKSRIQFTGGLEAARLKDWHVERLTWLKPKQMFFAYDTPNDYEPLVVASKILKAAGFTRSHMRCYVLIGYPRDTFELAESRLRQCVELGFYPAAMLWRNLDYFVDVKWQRFQRLWMSPAIISQRLGTAVYCGSENTATNKCSPKPVELASGLHRTLIYNI